MSVRSVIYVLFWKPALVAGLAASWWTFLHSWWGLTQLSTLILLSIAHLVEVALEELSERTRRQQLRRQREVMVTRKTKIKNLIMVLVANNCQFRFPNIVLNAFARFRWWTIVFSRFLTMGIWTCVAPLTLLSFGCCIIQVVPQVAFLFC